MSVWRAEILAVLVKRYPGLEDDDYQRMCDRVMEQVEQDPVDEVDRLFLGGRDGELSDAEVAVERTAVEARRRLRRDVAS